MAGSQAGIEIRQLFHLHEFEEVLEMQKTIWSFADVELLPLRFLVVVSKDGRVVADFEVADFLAQAGGFFCGEHARNILG